MNTIGNSLDSFYRKFKVGLYEKVLEDVGSGREDALTLQEVVYMEIIVALESPTVHNFATLAKLSDPNAAYRVRQMIEKGYLQKVQSTKDKREYHLIPTNKYIERIGILTNYLDLVAKRIEERFPEEDVRKMDEMLQIICSELTPEIEDRLVEELKR